MYTLNTSVDTVVDALKTFLTPFCGGATIVRSQRNRVSLPPSPCVVLTDILETDLSIPYVQYLSSTMESVKTSTRIDVQVDFYGALSSDYCRAVKSAIRSGFGFDMFPSNIKPLYASDGFNMPLIMGEHQYESRYVLTISMQYNPSFIVPQSSTSAVAPNSPIPIF